MMRLMSGNLFRLGKNNIFRLALFGCAAAGVICPWSGWQLARNSGGTASGYCMDYYLFAYSVVVAVAAALLCGFFTGIEYGDGTLRNKVAAGEARGKIYLSFLFTNMLAACALYTVYLAVDAPFARLFLGPPQHLGAGDAAQLLACAYLLMIALAAVFTMFALGIPNRTFSLSACLGVVLALIFLGSYHINILTDTALWEAVAGAGRTRALFLLNFLPGGQLVQYFRLGILPEKWNGLLMAGGSVFFTGASTLIGLLIFCRKDLK